MASLLSQSMNGVDVPLECDWVSCSLLFVCRLLILHMPHMNDFFSLGVTQCLGLDKSSMHGYVTLCF